MIWIVIIGGIIIFLIYNGSKINEGRNRIIAQGGMRKKYNYLIQYILKSDVNAHIFKETADTIYIGSENISGKTVFIITQTFERFAVKWRVDSKVFGEHALDWNFNEFDNQELVIKKIEEELGHYQERLIKQKSQP